ncbi:MAG: alpha/beta hydrolase [Bacteroidota bacterium]
MKKRFTLLFLVVCIGQVAFSQQMVLKKGTILESLPVHDSLPDTFSLYLPSNFSTDKSWPLLVVFDLKGREKQTMSMFVSAAEDEGYILAAPKVYDSLSLSNNIIKAGRSIKKVLDLLPIQKSRIYSVGAQAGARFANLVPLFIKEINGVISIGAAISNTELLDVKRPFHFVGIVDKKNFNYTPMLATEKVLDRYRFPNQILLYDGDKEWPDLSYLKKAMQLFTLAAMAKGNAPKDSAYVQNAFEQDVVKVDQLKNSGKLLHAEQYLGELMSIYGAHKNLDSLRLEQKNLRRDKQFRTMKRAENAAFLKESLLKEDYLYYMEEDLVSHNFNNLGWWNYQMDEINKFLDSPIVFEREMGSRLLGYVNALAEDNIDIVNAEDLIDEDALAFLYMLKTILEPQNFEFYLKIISLSAKNEDFGTALFYLEEALKKGFQDKERLYSLEDTALLRIDAKFNKLVAKYLKDARYTIEEQ